MRATVDPKGTLRFSKATLKALGVRASGGMVAVELPIPPRPLPRAARPPRPPAPSAKPGTPHVHGPDCEHSTYEGAPKLFISLRPDGSLEIRRQRIPPYKTVVPGAPGTVFLAASEKGKLVLARPK